MTNDSAFSVTKTANQTSVVAGSSTPITYTITVTNTGHSTSTAQEQVADAAPAGSTLVAGSETCSAGPPTCTFVVSPGGVITWTIAPGVSGGTSYTLTFSVTANGNDANNSTITNAATYSGPGCANAACFTSPPTQTTVTNNSAFTVTKAASPMSPGSVVAGSGAPILYTITATNTGASTSGSQLVVVDAVPTGTTLVAGSDACAPSGAGLPTCTAGLSGNSVVWSVPAGVPGGAFYTMTFEVTANAGDATGSISNAALWVGPGCSNPSGCSTLTVTTGVNNNSAFMVTKTANPASPASVVAGSSTPIKYTITAQNTGTSTSTATVTVTDSAPAGTTLVAGSEGCAGGPPTCNFVVSPSGAITWTIPAGVAGGGSYSLTFSVTANATDATGSINNVATWSGPGCTTNLSCSTGPTSTGVTNNGAFTLSKAASPSNVVAGSSTPILYTITATNSGASTTGAAATVNDSAPAGTTLVAGSEGCAGGPPTCTFVVSPSGAITWTIPAGVAGGGAYSLTFEVTANASDATGPIGNTATWTGPGCTTSPNCSTSSPPTTITNNAAFTVVKTANPAGSVTTGQTITYTITAKNTGTSTSTVPLNIVDNAPTGTTLVATSATCPTGQTAASTPGCAFTVNGSTVTWNITSVPGGGTEAVTFAVTVSPTASGTISNTANWTGPGCVTAPSTSCSTNTQGNAVQFMSAGAFGLTATASLGKTPILTVPPTPTTGSIITTGTTSVGHCVLTLTGLIKASTICAAAATKTNPDISNADASIAEATVGITSLPVISVGAVSTSSTTSCSTGSIGSTTIAFLAIGSTVIISQPTKIAPNTKISVAGITLILNEQVAITGVDKGLTVNAVHILVNPLGLNLVTANVIISSATSDIGNC